jgi:hypothetical protein
MSLESRVELTAWDVFDGHALSDRHPGLRRDSNIPFALLAPRVAVLEAVDADRAAAPALGLDEDPVTFPSAFLPKTE